MLLQLAHATALASGGQVAAVRAEDAVAAGRVNALVGRKHAGIPGEFHQLIAGRPVRDAPDSGPERLQHQTPQHCLAGVAALHRDVQQLLVVLLRPRVDAVAAHRPLRALRQPVPGGARPSQDLRAGLVEAALGLLDGLLFRPLGGLALCHDDATPGANQAVLEGILVIAGRKRHQSPLRPGGGEIRIDDGGHVLQRASDHLQRASAVPERPPLQEHGGFRELVVVVDDVAKHGVVLTCDVLLLHDPEVSARLGQKHIEAVPVVHDRTDLGDGIQPPQIFSGTACHDDLGLRRQTGVDLLLGLVVHHSAGTRAHIAGAGVLVGVHTALHR
mmetsp:Transcript_3544/g.11135  ORF Transcript_3544/g.11135 Transcript_3544/m.11135 type:complete len:330 (+) Transcript_3544:1135-2124(+)